jgi:hypothetical protein
LLKGGKEIWSTVRDKFFYFFKKNIDKQGIWVLSEMLRGSSFRNAPFKIQPSKELFAGLVGSPIEQPTRKRVDRGP